MNFSPYLVQFSNAPRTDCAKFQVSVCNNHARRLGALGRGLCYSRIMFPAAPFLQFDAKKAALRSWPPTGTNQDVVRRLFLLQSANPGVSARSFTWPGGYESSWTNLGPGGRRSPRTDPPFRGPESGPKICEVNSPVPSRPIVASFVPSLTRSSCCGDVQRQIERICQRWPR